MTSIVPHADSPTTGLGAENPHPEPIDSSYEVIASPSDIDKSRKVTLPCHLIRPHTRNADFYPQDHLLRLIGEALLPDNIESADAPHRDLKTFVLCGLGGIGKTELALEFVFTHQSQYDAVFFVHANDSTRLSEEFTRIALKLGLVTENEKTDAALSCELVKEWLADPVKTSSSVACQASAVRNTYTESVSESRRANWLLVFDDVNSLELLQTRFWPTFGKGAVLVTSRDPVAKSPLFFGSAGIFLNSFSAEDGAAFVRRLTESESQDPAQHAESLQAAHDVAQKLGGLPLAIAQAAAHMRRHELLLTEFRDIYEEDMDLNALHDLRIGSSHRGYKHSLASVWALDDLDPSALSLLNVLSMLEPDCIQEGILDGEVPGLEETPDYPCHLKEYHAALSRLLQSSLVQRDASRREIRIHRLVQEAARARMKDNAGELAKYFDVATLLILIQWPYIPDDGIILADRIKKRSKCEELSRHLDHLALIYHNFYQSTKSARRLMDFVELLIKAARYHCKLANPGEAYTMLNQAGSICRRVGEDAVAQLSRVNEVSLRAMAATNDVDSCLLPGKERFDIEEKVYTRTGEASTNMAAAYCDLGIAHMMSRQYLEAVPLFHQSIEMHRKTSVSQIRGLYRDTLYCPLYHLALASWYQGEYNAASDLLLEALHDREESHGINDPYSTCTGIICYALGNVRSSQGLLDESFSWHQRALLQLRATGGDTNRYTAQACYRVAQHHLRNGDYEEASRLLDQALKAYGDGDGWSYSADVARIKFLKAQLLKASCKPAEAQTMLEQSVKSFNRRCPGMPRTVDNLTDADFQEVARYGFGST